MLGVVRVAFPHERVVAIGDQGVHDEVLVVLLGSVQRVFRFVDRRARLEHVAEKVHLIEACLWRERRVVRGTTGAAALVVGEQRDHETVFVDPVEASSEIPDDRDDRRVGVVGVSLEEVRTREQRPLIRLRSGAEHLVQRAGREVEVPADPRAAAGACPCGRAERGHRRVEQGGKVDRVIVHVAADRGRDPLHAAVVLRPMLREPTAAGASSHGIGDGRGNPTERRDGLGGQRPPDLGFAPREDEMVDHHEVVRGARNQGSSHLRYNVYSDTMRMSSGKMARLTRAESKANTRAALIDAAEHEFARDGYHATTIERIVEHAGFTRGAFYAHFADKADIFLSLLEDRNEDNLQMLHTQLAAHDWDDHAAFAAWFDRGTAQVGAIERAFAEFRSVAASTPEYAARLRRRLHDVQRTVVELVETAAAQTGVELTMAPDDFATIAIALVDGFAIHHQLDPAGAPPQLLSDAMELLWSAATRTDVATTQQTDAS